MIDPITLTALVQISHLALNLARTLTYAPKARDGLISLVSGRSASKKNKDKKSDREIRIREEEIKYYKRKEKREKEFQKFQERIEQGRAERELRTIELKNKELELKKEEAEDRRKISALYHDLLREIQQNDIQIKLKEIQTDWDKDYWISKLSRDETKDILQKYAECLLILTSPLSIAIDNSLTSLRNLDFNLGMRRVGDFLQKYYSPQDQLHPLRFYSDYFKEPIGGIDADRLHSVLTPISTYIFYTDITVDAVTFRVRHWRLPDSEVSEFPAIEWNWKEAKQELITQGKTEEEALEIIRKIIIETHKLLAVFYAVFTIEEWDKQKPKLTATIRKEMNNKKDMFEEIVQEIGTNLEKALSDRADQATILIR